MTVEASGNMHVANRPVGKFRSSMTDSWRESRENTAVWTDVPLEIQFA